MWHPGTPLMSKKKFRYLRNLAIASLSLYVLICCLLYIFQDALLFHPRPNTKAQITSFLQHYPKADTISFGMSDLNNIVAYILKDTGSAKQPLIIYFGGNAEEVSHVASKKEYFPHATLVLVNYRGYGQSSGSPSEKNMFSDALDIYDHLIKRTDIDPEKIVVVGRSIGTGVATFLASKRPLKAVVLITPYESMSAVASEKYPFLPINLLIKHPFESKKYAKGINAPVLALIATHDAVIPKQHAYKLLESWQGKTYFLETDADHNSIMNNEATWQRIEEFVSGYTN